jgi:hypothetical protein
MGGAVADSDEKMESPMQGGVFKICMDAHSRHI